MQSSPEFRSENQEIIPASVAPNEHLDHFRDQVAGRKSREELVQVLREMRTKDLDTFSVSEDDLRKEIGLKFNFLSQAERQTAVNLSNDVLNAFRGPMKEILLEVENNPRLLQLIEKGVIPIVSSVSRLVGDSSMMQGMPESEPLTEQDRAEIDQYMKKWEAKFEGVVEQLKGTLESNPQYKALMEKAAQFSSNPDQAQALLGQLLQNKPESPKQDASAAKPAEQASSASESTESATQSTEAVGISASIAKEAISDFEKEKTKPLAREMLLAKLRMAGVDIEASQKAGALGESPSAEKLVAMQGEPSKQLMYRILGFVEFALITFRQNNSEKLSVGANAEKKTESSDSEERPPSEESEAEPVVKNNEPQESADSKIPEDISGILETVTDQKTHKMLSAYVRIGAITTAKEARVFVRYMTTDLKTYAKLDKAMDESNPLELLAMAATGRYSQKVQSAIEGMKNSPLDDDERALMTRLTTSPIKEKVIREMRRTGDLKDE